MLQTLLLRYKKTFGISWTGVGVVFLVGFSFLFLLASNGTVHDVRGTSTRSKSKLHQQTRIKVFASQPNSRRHPQQEEQDLLFQLYLERHADIFQNVAMDQRQQKAFLKAESHLCGDSAVARFQELLHSPQSHLALQVWSFCALYVNGGVFLDFSSSSSSSNSLVLLQPLHAILLLGDDSRNVNKAILNDETLFPNALHGSFLYLSQPYSDVALGMLHLLLNTSIVTLQTSPLLLPQILYALVERELFDDGSWNETEAVSPIQPGEYYFHHQHQSDQQSSNNNVTSHGNRNNSWYFLQQKCHVNPVRFLPSLVNKRLRNQPYDEQHYYPCPRWSGYCCHVYDRAIPAVVGVTRDALGPYYPTIPSLDQLPQPYNRTASKLFREVDLPYISTLDEQILHVPKKTDADAEPNSDAATNTTTANVTTSANSLYETLLQMNCLPTKQCSFCYSSCDRCMEECRCYCKSICNTFVPPLPIGKQVTVRPPRYRRDPTRLIPRIIHQTWYEEIEAKKYPTTGRLRESFRQSGWEYRFYTDEMAADFLSTHFPAEVRQAYDALLPGAFRADLFRYGVLLVHGGVYADVDILLESNLDAVIDSDVGFMTPFDSMPGAGIGHRMCLWNGLIATAPGHPFLAKAIETVVNNVRSRFTVAEYDNMFCPNPEISIIRNHDDLFTSGPCILGAAVNYVLGRHGQDQFEQGELNHENANVTIPGRSIILQDNKHDMEAHRFTLWEKNIIVAATEFSVNDRQLPPGKLHYSKVRHTGGVYGVEGLYVDMNRSDADVMFIVATNG